MKALRILILVVFLPVFASAMLADAIDQGSIGSMTLQISSLTDDLDLLCGKTKLCIALSDPPEPARPLMDHRNTMIHESTLTAGVRFLLPFFLRAPPLA